MHFVFTYDIYHVPKIKMCFIILQLNLDSLPPFVLFTNVGLVSMLREFDDKSRETDKEKNIRMSKYCGKVRGGVISYNKV